MRAVLQLPTPEITIEQLRDALKGTTWLPSASPAAPWIEARVDELLQEFPTNLQTQLKEAGVVYLQVDLTVEGLASLERQGAVMIRLIHDGDDGTAIKKAVADVAQVLPQALQETIGGNEIILSREIVIRQKNSGVTVAKGEIVTPHTLRFWKYLQSERSREYRLLRWLCGVFALALISASILEFIHPITLSWPDVMRGHTERLTSALFVAILTTLINLTFEYRDWRSQTTEVRWLFG